MKKKPDNLNYIALAWVYDEVGLLKGMRILEYTADTTPLVEDGETLKSKKEGALFNFTISNVVPYKPRLVTFKNLENVTDLYLGDKINVGYALVSNDKPLAYSTNNLASYAKNKLLSEEVYQVIPQKYVKGRADGVKYLVYDSKGGCVTMNKTQYTQFRKTHIVGNHNLYKTECYGSFGIAHELCPWRQGITAIKLMNIAEFRYIPRWYGEIPVLFRLHARMPILHLPACIGPVILEDMLSDMPDALAFNGTAVLPFKVSLLGSNLKRLKLPDVCTADLDVYTSRLTELILPQVVTEAKICCNDHDTEDAYFKTEVKKSLHFEFNRARRLKNLRIDISGVTPSFSFYLAKTKYTKLDFSNCNIQTSEKPMLIMIECSSSANLHILLPSIQTVVLKIVNRTGGGDVLIEHCGVGALKINSNITYAVRPISGFNDCQIIHVT